MTSVTTAQPHRFTAEEYVGLDIPGRTELLGGSIYDVSPRNEPHRYAVRALNRILAAALADSAYVVQVQDSVAVPGWKGNDAPEIDVAVIANRRYELGPTSGDALAFVEVSDSTYATDRNYKIPLYVRAGIASWVVNISKRQIEYYGAIEHLDLPNGCVFAEGETVEIAGVLVAVSDLF